MGIFERLDTISCVCVVVRPTKIDFTQGSRARRTEHAPCSSKKVSVTKHHHRHTWKLPRTHAVKSRRSKHPWRACSRTCESPSHLEERRLEVISGQLNRRKSSRARVETEGRSASPHASTTMLWIPPAPKMNLHLCQSPQ